MFQSALIGGLVMGALSGLPFIQAGNICCCLWVILGGAVGAYLLQQKRETPITAGDGAVVGLLAGLIGSAVYVVVAIPVTLIMAPMQQQMLDTMINSGDVPPEVQQFFSTQFTGFLGIIFGFFAMLAAGIIFSTLGGLVGALIFKKSQPPMPPPMSSGPQYPTGFGAT